MAKPTHYDDLYPSRFLKAGLFKGNKVTLTIKDVDIEELMGEDNKPKDKVILSFAERPMQHVVPKTNAICIKAMFGPHLADWIGKKITLFESSWNGEPCIRVWGSPEIKAEMNVSVQLPRRKAFMMVMHAVKAKPEAVAGKKSADPRVLAAWELLGWSISEGEEDWKREAISEVEYLNHLNAKIDTMNAEGAA